MAAPVAREFTTTDVIAIDERGYPVRMAVNEPRAFALHNACRATIGPRDGPRDFEQARAALRSRRTAGGGATARRRHCGCRPEKPDAGPVRRNLARCFGVRC
jgi:hypothetical protein